ncbi:MAG TPA: sigma 54-interacting transcriptional regulator [Burkholderiales bacterium]|jgi:DNA-binding NtrC family response regulator|nr:sigma 54-interacting transcriptional regulator [Burkholderiales bacterium]
MTSQRILVVDDEADIRSLLREILSEEGYEIEVAADAAQACASRARQNPDLVLLDVWMPDTDGITLLREWSRGPTTVDCPVVMISGHGTVETAVEATRLGAFDFVEKPLSLAKVLRTVERALDAGRQKRQRESVPLPPPFAPVGRSRAMQLIREQVQQVAPHDAPILLLGESGTGREALARYIHSLSPRSAQPLVAVAAGSLAEETAAALLHGRETAAGVEPGVYDQADAGTLFINGLEDLLPAAQRLLFADIENGHFTRLGAAQSRPLNVRFMSSAQPGLDTRGVPEPFRRDLLWHLDVVTLRVPPLREYAEDVPDLLRYYVDRLTDDGGLPFRHFSLAAQNRLRNYPWPGNIHELKNLVQRLLILKGGEEIGLDEIERELSSQLPADEPLMKQDVLALPLREAREQFERTYLQQQLLICNGKVEQLAKRVGLERTHAYRKFHSLGLGSPLREAREQFERAYLQKQLLICNGKVEQLAKRVGMERTHLYRKLHSLGVDFRNVTHD